MPNGLVVMATECDKYRQPIGIGGWGGQEMSAIVVDGDHTKHTTAIEIMGAHKLQMYDVNGWSPSHVAGVKEK